MRRLLLLPVSIVLLLLLSGMVLSQDSTALPSPTPTETPQIAFSIEGEIGRALPQKIVYDPHNERMAVVDAYSRLLLLNALDYKTLAVLHERGEYGDIAFSHDGRWLAVAYGVTMELWDTESYQLVGSLPNLGNVRRLLGPIAFSSNDEILIFYGIYPAPRELRVTETDSITYPWVWHLPAARKEAESTLPGGLEAIQMVDYANGFVLSPDDKIVAALPARLRVLDAFTLTPEYEIPTNRYEQDPLTVWFSLRDNSVYVRPVTSNTLLQVDTGRGVLVEVPMNQSLTQGDLDLIGGLEVGSLAQVIDEPASRSANPLLQIFLGDYRHSNAYGDRPLTVTLIDLVLPPATTPDNVLALLYVYDENARTGQFQFSNSGSVQQMALSPDGKTLLLRRSEGEEYVLTYDVASGRELRRFIPAQRGIGSYSRGQKNRVLAYDPSGAIIISDFQRLNTDTNAVLAEDLRYSRSFDRFFFSDDSQKIITLAGTEWREWDIASGAVLRREVVNLNGSIIATSADGYRYLTIYNDGYSGGAEVVDMNTGERYAVSFSNISGSSIYDIYPNSSWTRFLVVYSENSYGPYYPGNQIALYDYQDGLKWLIAGDDLPPVEQRLYGWVDEDMAYVYGQGRASELPGRVYGVDYATSGLPGCIVSAYPEQTDTFNQLWERLMYYLRADEIDAVSQKICGDLPDSADEVAQMLVLTATPERIVVTGAPVGPVPQCLLDRYPGEVDAYSELWLSLTENLTAGEAQEIAVMLCEGIGVISTEGEFDPSLGYTMFLDAETGERASGDYQAPAVESRPLQPIYELFEKTEKRPLGTAILSQNNELVAASSMPGELVIYRLLVTYNSLMAQLTATAVFNLQQANLIQAQPSPSPTYSLIGTPRPTLTPTPEQTLYPRPQEQAFTQVAQTDFCPAETLYSIDNPPMSYDADGRLFTEVQGDYLWSVDLKTGTRQEDPEILQCGRGIQCQISPDHSWILAESYDSIFITRPDNSDPRTLWDLRTPYPATPVPYEIHWSGNRTLEWMGSVPVTVPAPTPYIITQEGYLRDVLNVFPDPNPWVPTITINQLPAQFVSRQPGGPWAIAYTTYNTGVGPGYKYYLYHTETNIYQLFAQHNDQTINVYWHPTGDRLFYNFPEPYSNPPTYQVVFPDISNQLLGYTPSGVWSNDGRYVAQSTDSRAQPIRIWDSLTGAVRTYCLPETGARLYSGPFTWSPDDGYLALQAPLPKDEAQEGVGQHTLILNVETGEVVDLTTGVVQVILWSQEPGSYGDGRVVTPTPIITFTPSPTASGG